MDGQEEKVYVALGSDLQDGFKTLEWTLKKWNSQPISIVILHVNPNISMELVSTPYGKLPASSVSEEKLEVIRKYEQAKVDKLLSKYIAFCGKVKAEVLKVDKFDEPIRKIIIDLISGIRITKLVMGLTFMKSSSGRSKGAISGSFYVHQNKPEFCELFIVCGGKLVFLKGENEEGIMEDDQGTMVAKMREKGSFKGWLGKILSNSSLERNLSQSSINLDSPNSRNQWDHCIEQLEKYFQQLLGEEDCNEENEEEPLVMPQEYNDYHLSVAEKTEYIRSKIDEAQKTVQLNRNKAKANLERHAKAEWAISLCNKRVQELETRTKEEFANRTDIEKDLDMAKEQFQVVSSDIQESKMKLTSLVDLQSDLSNKLRRSCLAKSQAENQLEKAVVARAEMVREIEELRRQRDVLQRRIEFCKEKEAIGKVAKLNEMSLIYREFTANEIRSATNDFSERMRLKCGGDWTNVYRGKINHLTVAIKMLNQLPNQVLQPKVRLLSHIRHPHLVGMIGFCSELNCMVLEYMNNGSLGSMLFSSETENGRKIGALQWHDRIGIATQVATGLTFLHTANPTPIVHANVTLCNILLDRNLVAKITGFGLTRSRQEHHLMSDIRAFGVVMLQLLVGTNWDVLVEGKLDQEALDRGLSEMALAGQWPMDLAENFARIGMRCVSDSNTDLKMETVLEQLNEMRNKANDLMNNGGFEVEMGGGNNSTEDVPAIFLCPIFKDVMKNPHVAADGFSYEQEAIKEWLGTGHDRSPMTNLRLNHTLLAPNHILRSLIQEWHYKRSSAA